MILQNFCPLHLRMIPSNCVSGQVRVTTQLVRRQSSSILYILLFSIIFVRFFHEFELAGMQSVVLAWTQLHEFQNLAGASIHKPVSYFHLNCPSNCATLHSNPWAHANAPACNSLKYPQINLLAPCLRWALAVSSPHPPANHSAYWRVCECCGDLFDLNWNFKTPSLHFPLFNQLFMEPANVSKEARMASKHSGSPELDSLFLTHNLWVYEALLFPQVSPEDPQSNRGVEGMGGRVGGWGGKEEEVGCQTGESAALDKGTELERWLQKGKLRRLADGGRWGLGYLGETEGWRGEDGRCRHKEDERQTVRQTANGERQAAPVINGWHCDTASGASSDRILCFGNKMNHFISSLFALFSLFFSSPRPSQTVSVCWPDK